MFRKEKMKIGDKVIDDLTGEVCVILNILHRNEVERLQNVSLVGNVYVLENPKGEQESVYGWEVTEIK